MRTEVKPSSLSHPLPSTLHFLILLIHPSSLFPSLLHHTDLPTLLLPATHSFSTPPSLIPICFSLSSYSPSPSLSLSARPAPCLLFHLLPLFSKPFPLRPYHLTLMRVFNHLYGGREGHEIPCLQEDQRWEDGERGREKHPTYSFALKKKKKSEMYNHPAAPCLWLNTPWHFTYKESKCSQPNS